MPVLSSKENIKKVKLPSFEDEAYVKVKSYISVGDVFSNVENFQGTDEREQSMRIITASIVDWNLTDEDGNKLEITMENVKKLHIMDFNAIAQAVNLTQTPLTPTKKKN